MRVSAGSKLKSNPLFFGYRQKNMEDKNGDEGKVNVALRFEGSWSRSWSGYWSRSRSGSR